MVHAAGVLAPTSATMRNPVLWPATLDDDGGLRSGRLGGRRKIREPHVVVSVAHGLRSGLNAREPRQEGVHERRLFGNLLVDHVVRVVNRGHGVGDALKRGGDSLKNGDQAIPSNITARSAASASFMASV